MNSRSVRLALAVLALVPAAALSATTTAKTTAAPTAGHAAMTVPFIDDDYARAISKARASKLPVFVEAWAPW